MVFPSNSLGDLRVPTELEFKWTLGDRRHLEVRLVSSLPFPFYCPRITGFFLKFPKPGHELIAGFSVF